MHIVAVLILSGVESSVPCARRFLRNTLVPDYLKPDDERLADMALVVDEFAGNGIRHTASGQGGKIIITLLEDGAALRIEVTDDGAGGARPALTPSPSDESGRGLHIVAALASRWGHHPDGVRTTVWAEFPCG